MTELSPTATGARRAPGLTTRPFREGRRPASDPARSCGRCHPTTLVFASATAAFVSAFVRILICIFLALILLLIIMVSISIVMSSASIW